MPKKKGLKHFDSWIAVGVVRIALIMTGMTVFNTAALSNTDNTTLFPSLYFDWRSQFISVASPSGPVEAGPKTHIAYYSINPDKHCLEYFYTSDTPTCIGWNSPGPLKSFKLDLEGTAVTNINGRMLTAEVSVPLKNVFHTLTSTVSQGSATMTFPEGFFPTYDQTTYGARVDIYVDATDVASGSTLRGLFAGMTGENGISIPYVSLDSYGVVGDSLNTPNPSHWVTITKPVLDVPLPPESPIGALPIQYSAEVARFILYAPSSAIGDVNMFSLRMSGSVVASILQPNGRYKMQYAYVYVGSNLIGISAWEPQGSDLVAYVNTSLGTVSSGTSKVVSIRTLLEGVHSGDTLTLTLDQLGPNAKVEFQTVPISGHNLTLTSSDKGGGKKK